MIILPKNNLSNKDKDGNLMSLLLTIVLPLCLLFITFNSISQGFNKSLIENSEDSGNSKYFIFVIFIIFTFSFIRRYYKIASKINVILFVYSLYYLVSSYLQITSFSPSFRGSLFLLLWVLCFKLGGNIAKLDDDKFNSFIYFFSLFIILPILIYTIKFIIQRNITLLFFGGIDAIFAVAVYLPFIFILNNKKSFKILMLLTLLLICLFSFKRSIILSVFIATLIYVLLTLNNANIYKLLFNKYTGLAVIAIFLLYRQIGSLFSNNFERFQNLSQDGGSGRTDIYNELLKVFFNSNSDKMLFGYGSQGTREYIGILAHNDFIQILFDFGIIGFVLYLLFILSLIIFAVKKSKFRVNYNNDYAAYVASILAFLILSLTNCIIYSPAYLSPLMLGIGILYFRIKKIKIIRDDNF